MRTVRIALACVAMIFATTGQAHAGMIPSGLQSNISQATLDSWGWTEISRSPSYDTLSEATIVSAATGDYLMMGVWDTVAQHYSILGAGETSAVTAITYQNSDSDNNGNYNPNWSNGLNFYRTLAYGSWGFTTNSVTDLSTADVFLLDGLISNNGNDEVTLSKGLTFHTNSGNLTGGWGYNVTGSDFQSLSNTERVFFTTNAATVPEPASLTLWSLGLVGITFLRLRTRQSVS